MKIEEEEIYYDAEKDQEKVIRKEVKWLATTLPKDAASSLVVYRMGRCRWWIENNGNRDLKTNWHWDHNFVHSATALPAIRLILFLAFNLFYLFLHRQHRAFRRDGRVTALAVALEFFKSYCHLGRRLGARKRRKSVAGGAMDSS